MNITIAINECDEERIYKWLLDDLANQSTFNFEDSLALALDEIIAYPIKLNDVIVDNIKKSFRQYVINFLNCI
jgi:hypothetical protein